MAVLRGWRDNRDERERREAGQGHGQAWQTLHARAPRGARQPGFLDRMLGRGAQASLARPMARPLAKPAPARPMARPRLEMHGSQAPQPLRHRGFLRAALALGLLAWALAAFKPWRHVPDLVAGLKSMRGHASAPKVMHPAAADPLLALLPTPVAAPAQTAAPTPAGTPVAHLREAAAALVKAGDGRWYAVDRLGYAEPSLGPDQPSTLGLPFLTGARVQAVAEGGQWRMKVSGAESLAGILPLRQQLATEVESIDLADPADPVLRTVDGATVRLGDGVSFSRQAWLAAVLADLAAKGKRASQIDLRFRGQAVVRLAAR
jgi:hypothetical protein